MTHSRACLRPFLPVFGLLIGILALVALTAPEASAGDLTSGAPSVQATYQSQRIAAAPVASRTTTRRRTSVAEPRTATQLAAMQGLSYSDHRSFVLLEGASLRIRLYPGKRNVVIAGREYQVKDRIVRNRNELQLTGRVSRFLMSRISQYRAQKHRPRPAPRPRQPLPALPPLPERRPFVAPKPTPVAITPVARPPAARARAAQSQAGWAPRVSERDWKWIVLHHSDTETGDLAKFDDYHRNVKHWENGCGYHFVVGNGTLSGDGAVEVGPRWVRQIQGAHAKVPGNRYNERGVGICLVGEFNDGAGRPSSAQMDELVNLVRWLKARYGIQDANIHGHCDCCSTCCPGKNFPWAQFRRRIAE